MGRGRGVSGWPGHCLLHRHPSSKLKELPQPCGVQQTPSRALESQSRARSGETSLATSPLPRECSPCRISSGGLWLELLPGPHAGRVGPGRPGEASRAGLWHPRARGCSLLPCLPTIAWCLLTPRGNALLDRELGNVCPDCAMKQACAARSAVLWDGLHDTGNRHVRRGYTEPAYPGRG